MKTMTFRYDPNPRRTVLASIRETIRTQKVDLRKDEVLFRRTADLFKLLTKTRLDIFTKIVEYRPESLSDLALLCDRDLGNLQKDVNALESLGLVRLEKVPGKRGDRTKPMPLYERVVVEYAPKRMKKAG